MPKGRNDYLKIEAKPEGHIEVTN